MQRNTNEVPLSNLLTNLTNGLCDDEEQASVVSNQMLQTFQEIKGKNIVLKGFNLADGIGDFKNLIDYYMWTESAFLGCNANIKAIALVSTNKLDMAMKVLPKELAKRKDQDIYIVRPNEEFNEEKAKNAKIIILSWEKSPTSFKDLNEKDFGKALNEKERKYFDQLIDSNPVLKNIFAESDLTLNIAVRFLLKDNVFGLAHLPKTSLVHSILEIGPVLYSKGSINSQSLSCYPDTWIENWMGVKDEEGGIGFKFDESVYQNSQSVNSIEEKSALLAKMENKKLLAFLCRKSPDQNISIEDTKKYFDSAWLGIGYLQDEKLTNTYLKLLMQTANTQHSQYVDAIINLKLVNLDEIKKYAFEQGYTDIEAIDIDGNPYPINLKDLHQEGATKKVLRLINFSGISDSDLEITTNVSAIVAGSGDNSMSNTIAAASGTMIPFFHIPEWKRDFFNRFIELIKSENDEGQHDNLIKYLNLIYDRFFSNEDVDKFCKFATANFEEIANSWKNIQEKIYEDHNAKDYFNQLVLSFVFSQLLKNSSLEELKPILKLFKQQDYLEVEFAGQNLFYLSLLNNNVEVANWLFKNNNSLINDKLPNDVNPIHYAIKTNNIDFIKFIIERGISVDYRADSEASTPLWYACKEGNKDMLKFLIDKGADISFIYKKSETIVTKKGYSADVYTEKSALSVACEYGHVDIVEELLNAAKLREINLLRTVETDSPLSLAIKNGHSQIVELLIKAGANVNVANDTSGVVPLKHAINSNHLDIAKILVNAGAAWPTNIATEDLSPTIKNFQHCINNINKAEASQFSFNSEFKKMYEKAAMFDKDYFYNYYVPSVLEQKHLLINQENKASNFEMLNKFIHLESVLATENPKSLLFLAELHSSSAFQNIKFPPPFDEVKVAQLLQKAKEMFNKNNDHFHDDEIDAKINSLHLAEKTLPTKSL